MVERDHISDEVEKTLQAFDNDPPLDENPFLLARIMAERDHRRGGRTHGVVPRIRLRYAVMMLIVVVNLITWVHYVDWNDRHALQERLVSELSADFQSEQSDNGF